MLICFVPFELSFFEHAKVDKININIKIMLQNFFSFNELPSFPYIYGFIKYIYNFILLTLIKYIIFSYNLMGVKK